MPGIALTISGHQNPSLVERVVPELTELACRVLEKRLDQTVFTLDFIPHDLWFIGNRSLAELDRNSFRLAVTITAETNTKAQKARFHREAFTLLSDLIGNLHPHSNVHTIDCRATSYGYGGVTQEYRFHHTP